MMQSPTNHVSGMVFWMTIKDPHDYMIRVPGHRVWNGPKDHSALEVEAPWPMTFELCYVVGGGAGDGLSLAYTGPWRHEGPKKLEWKKLHSWHQVDVFHGLLGIVLGLSKRSGPRGRGNYLDYHWLLEIL